MTAQKSSKSNNVGGHRPPLQLCCPRFHHGPLSIFAVDRADFSTQNVKMVRVAKIAVLILVFGLAVTSYCAQACAMPQPAASDCPQHHQPGTTNCCEHSPTDATMTAKADCSLGIKSTSLLFLPLQPANSSILLNRNMDVHQRYDPPDSVLSYSVLAAPSVLRV